MSDDGSGTRMNPLLAKLREAALSYPETTEEFPWGDRVVKVRGKVFVFMGQDREGRFGCSLKLPQSGAVALGLPFAEPTGYGLGRSGWVSLRGPELARAPFAVLRDWLDESFRAVAPKKLVAALEAGGFVDSAPAQPTRAKPRKAKAKSRSTRTPARRKRAR